ncbi:MAG: DinB family protein [Anaerolineae bacterium]
MPTAEQQVHIDKIRAFPAELDALLATIKPDELDNRITPDEWCTRQIVHHLADSHTRALLLMKNILFEDKPMMVPWKQADFAETADYKQPIEPSVNIIHGIHTRIVALLESVSEVQWQRTGMHHTRGEMTLEAVAALYAWHGGNHIDQINKTLGRAT